MSKPIKKNTVSIIVPVYNTEKYLHKCIPSMTGQTYKNIEIILIDDGSTDESARICDDWSALDSRIRVIRQENQGAGLARNAGIACAAGEYICFLDSDDYIDSTTIEKCVTFITENKLDAVIFGSHHVSSQGKVKPVPLNPSRHLFKTDDIQKELIPSFFTGSMGFGVSVWGKMYRTDKIRKNNVTFHSERQVYSEDALFNLEYFAKAESAGILLENLYYHFENEESLSRTYKKEREEKNDAFLIHCMDYIKAEGLPEKIGLHIQARYHAFTMVTLKQIMMSAFSFSEKWSLLKESYEKENLRETLGEEVLGLEKKSMSFFFRMVRKRWYPICNLLLWYKVYL